MSKRDELVEEVVSNFLEKDDVARGIMESNPEVAQAFQEFAETSVDFSVAQHKASMEYADNSENMTNGQPGSSSTYREVGGLLEVNTESIHNLMEVVSSQGVGGAVDGESIQSRAFHSFRDEMRIHGRNASVENRDEMANKFEEILEEQQPTGIAKLVGNIVSAAQDLVDPLPRYREKSADEKPRIQESPEVKEQMNAQRAEHKSWMESRGEKDISSLDTKDMGALDSISQSLAEAAERSESSNAFSGKKSDKDNSSVGR